MVGFSLASEHFRSDQISRKLDLKFNNQYIGELFSFPDPPARPTGPEACGLKQMAFSVANLAAAWSALEKKGVVTQPIRTDEYTGKQFTFFPNPCGLPIERSEL